MDEAREFELGQIGYFRRAMAYLQSAEKLVSISIPISIFAYYTFVEGKTLTADVAFPAIAWISPLQGAIHNLPSLFNMYSKIMPSAERLSKLIGEDERRTPYAVALATAGVPKERIAALVATQGNPGGGGEGRGGGGGGGRGGGGGGKAGGYSRLEEDEEDGSKKAAVTVTVTAPAPGEACGLTDARLVVAAGDDGGKEAKAAIAEGKGGGKGGGGGNGGGGSGSKGGGGNGKGAGGNGNGGGGNGGAADDEPEPPAVVFESATLSVRLGELMVVVGVSGSGKSTLLAALSGARSVGSGVQALHPSRAYVAQKPFLCSSSVMDNILFGLPFDRERYEAVLTAMALYPDLEALPEGDQTYIGDSGVQLSGGQRARVAFGRALYAQSSTLFLDDVFSAVDVRTGQVHDLSQPPALPPPFTDLTHLTRHAPCPVPHAPFPTSPSPRLAANPSHAPLLAVRTDLSGSCLSLCLPLPDSPSLSLQILWEAVRVSLAQGTTIVLVTHQLQLLAKPEVSRVCFVHSGEIRLVCPWKELQPQLQHHPQLKTLLEHSHQGDPIDEAAAASAKKGAADPDLLSPRRQSVAAPLPPGGVPDEFVSFGSAVARLKAVLWQRMGRKVDALLIRRLVAQVSGDADKGADAKADGEVTNSSFLWYLELFGTAQVKIFFILIATVAAVFSVAQRYYLANWTDSNEACAGAATAANGCSAAADETRQMLLYALIGATATLLFLGESLCAVEAALSASRRVHRQLLKGVTHATTQFFDGTARGQILNRMIQDMQKVDMQVSNLTTNAFHTDDNGGVLGMLAILGSVSLVSPSALLLFFIALPCYWCAPHAQSSRPTSLPCLPPCVRIVTDGLTVNSSPQSSPFSSASFRPPLLIPARSSRYVFQLARISNRDCRRIESAAASPINTHFSDTVQGRETIAAFGAEPRFLERHRSLVRSQATCVVGARTAMCWGQFWWACIAFTMITTYGILLLCMRQAALVSTAFLALGLVQSEELTNQASWFVFMLGNLEINFVAVERLLEYVRLLPETGVYIDADDEDAAHSLQRSLPKRGEGTGGSDANGASAPPALVFSDVWFRYQLYSPRVLRGLDLSVEGGTKLALCGRTGCGKSSTFSAALRLYPLEKGSIFLGDVDLSRVPLHELRGAIRLVAQACAEPTRHQPT